MADDESCSQDKRIPSPSSKSAYAVFAAIRAEWDSGAAEPPWKSAHEVFAAFHGERESGSAKPPTMSAHAAIAGSSVLGDRVVLGGQSGVGDHLKLGDDVIAAGATAILSNVPSGRIMMGYPAMRMDQNIEAYKALRRLPRILERLRGAKGWSNSETGN